MSTVIGERSGCRETAERQKRLLLLLDHILQEYHAAIELAKYQRELDKAKLVVWVLQQPRPGPDVLIAQDKRHRIEEKFRRKLQRLRRRWIKQSFAAFDS